MRDLTDRETAPRLAHGGRIDRTRPLTFTFDGRTLTGFAGDTLASALLANGVHLVGRSFKVHRPRGIVGHRENEPNALMRVGTGDRVTPNLPATLVELTDGLVAESQNRWPSLKYDLQAVSGLLKPMFTAGFYYKTFMWPAAFWEKVYEPAIRRAAGLGKATTAPDPDRYERGFKHCDLLVVGAGPAGLTAALWAGRAGLHVILAEQDIELGGSLLTDRSTIDGEPASLWVDRIAGELESLDNVEVMARTTVFGYYDHNILGALERLPAAEHAPRERYWRIEAGRVTLAAGALERPIPFPDNDRPGIMLASAVRAYLNRWAVRAGTRAVVFANNDDGFATARDLSQAGMAVTLVDSRDDAELPRALTGLEVTLHRGRTIAGSKGRRRVSEVTLDDGTRLPCDLVAVAGGWNPSVNLHSQTGAKPVWDSIRDCFVPGEPKQNESSVGSCAGRFTTAEAIQGGAYAAVAAVRALGKPVPELDLPVPEDPPAGRGASLWYVPGHDSHTFLDPQHDVTVADVKLAHREGYRSVEHMKRYTTLGMATDQGRFGNINGMAVMAEARGLSVAEVGTTTFRPPYTPVSVGALAGRKRQQTFMPLRRSPLHDWAADRGAIFAEAGLWKRSRAFPQDGESLREASFRETTQTRMGVGICDVSTLGKIDIQGPDAPELLNRVYTNGWKRLAVGRARYGLMLREDGHVMDDGTTSCLAEGHYHMTTTTGQAPKVMSHLEWCLQALWTDLDVQVQSVTDQWAGLAVAGPNSRALLQRLLPDVDLSNAAFPFMGVGQYELPGGVPLRLFRISFSGELAFEVNVPADYGPALADKLLELGEDLGAIPYGLEALDVMRIEKGHVTAGELDGRTTAADLGMAGLMSSKKDFIGRALAQRPGMADPSRPRLVGLKCANGDERIRAGSHLLPTGTETTVEHDQGWVSSATWSPTFGHHIALGFLKNGAERMGEVVRAVDLVRGHDVELEVVSPHFYDPEGTRQRG